MSTGQGILGNNMFAYCGNNPVNGCDPYGTCFHRWDFWNDCEDCGGSTFDQKIYNSAKKIKNYHVLQEETQNVIIQQQTQLIKNACQQSLERSAYRIQTQIDSQYQQDMGTIRVAKYLAENPMIAIDIAADTTAVVTWYTGLCILLVPLNVPVVGQIILSALGGAATFWGIGRNSVSTWRNVGEIFYGEEY